MARPARCRSRTVEPTADARTGSRPSPWARRRAPRRDPRAAPWRPPWWSPCASRRRCMAVQRRPRARSRTASGRGAPSRRRRQDAAHTGNTPCAPTAPTRNVPGDAAGDHGPSPPRGTPSKRQQPPYGPRFRRASPDAPRRTPTRMGFGAASAGAATARARDASPNRGGDSRRLGGSPRTEAHPSRRPSPRACRPPSPRTRTSPPRPPRPRARPRRSLPDEPRDDRAAIRRDGGAASPASKLVEASSLASRACSAPAFASLRRRHTRRARSPARSGTPHRRRRWCRRETPPAQTPRTLRPLVAPLQPQAGGAEVAGLEAVRGATLLAPIASAADIGGAPRARRCERGRSSHAARRALLTSHDSTADVERRVSCALPPPRGPTPVARPRVAPRCTTPRARVARSFEPVPPRPHRVADPRPRGARPPAASPVLTRDDDTRDERRCAPRGADGPEPGHAPSFPRALRAPERRWRRVRVRAAARPAAAGPRALFKHEVAFALGQDGHGRRRDAQGDGAAESGHSMVRHEAAEALGAIASDACLEALETASEDASQVVRETAPGAAAPQVRAGEAAGRPGEGAGEVHRRRRRPPDQLGSARSSSPPARTARTRAWMSPTRRTFPSDPVPAAPSDVPTRAADDAGGRVGELEGSVRRLCSRFATAMTRARSRGPWGPCWPPPTARC